MAGGPRAAALAWGSILDNSPRAWIRTSCLKRCVLFVAAVSLLGATVAILLAKLNANHATTHQVAQLVSVTAAAMFLGAGVLRIARWRIVRDSRSMLMGTALVVFGGISIPLTYLADLLVEDDSTSHLRAAVAVVTTLVTMALVARALTAPPEVELRPVPVLAGACLTALGLFGLVLTCHFIAPDLLRSSVVAPPLLRGTMLATAWFALTYIAALGSERRPWAGRLAPLLACMSVSELLRVTQVFLPGGWSLSCVVLLAAVAALTARRALLDLDEATKRNTAQLEVVVAALSHSQAGMDAYQAWQEELVHDAKNALAGLRAALHTMQQYGDRIDSVTGERLRSAAIGEVGHLEEMIVRGGGRETTDFDIAEAINATVETRRAAGLDVEPHTFSCKAHGHPGDLATTVQNILVNSQVHARGAHVRICVVPAGQKVHVYIADDGPGLTDAQAAKVFERGSRRTTSPGSGLGLYVARSLMRQQGGDVELRAHFEGAVFVITLPAAHNAPHPALFGEQRPTPASARKMELLGEAV